MLLFLGDAFVTKIGKHISFSRLIPYCQDLKPKFRNTNTNSKKEGFRLLEMAKLCNLSIPMITKLDKWLWKLNSLERNWNISSKADGTCKKNKSYVEYIQSKKTHKIPPIVCYVLCSWLTPGSIKYWYWCTSHGRVNSNWSTSTSFSSYHQWTIQLNCEYYYKA